MYIASQTFTSNTSWTAPAGVTTVVVTPSSNANPYSHGVGTVVTVVPNTTYSITATTGAGSCSFGSLYRASGLGVLIIAWTE